MKGKTSITLSKDILKALDRLAGSNGSRSAIIESILAKFLRDRARAARHARDLARINRSARRLNREAEEVLEYQATEL